MRGLLIRYSRQALATLFGIFCISALVSADEHGMDSAVTEETVTTDENLVQEDSVQSVVEYAIKHSPDVNARAAEKRAVAKEIEGAEGGYLPRIDFDAGYGYEETNNLNTRGRGDGGWKHSRKELGLFLDQMIFDGFLTKHEVLRQIKRADSRAYQVYSQAEIDALNASRAYVNLLRQEKLVELAQENLDIHIRTNDQIVLRSEQGVGRQADAEQSSARLSRARTNIIAEKGNYQDEVANFFRVVGRAPGQLSEPFNPFDVLPASLDDALTLARENHPTIKQAVADVESALAQKDSAKAAYYPRLNLEMRSRWDDDIAGIPDEDEEYSAMLRLRYNLFNGGSDKARIEETVQLIDQARQIRDSAIRQVEQSVRLSWHAYEVSSQQLDFFEKNRDATINAFEAYKQQFTLGQRTLLDLLDSANEMFVAKSDYENTRVDKTFASYRIFASMGMLHKTLDVPLPVDTALTDYSCNAIVCSAKEQE